MNYFELINKCLIELNYREVDGWDRLTLNDHKRLKDILNRLNSQICSSENWSFLQRFMEMEIFAGTTRIPIPITGKVDILCFNDNEYTYSDNYKSFLLGNPVSGRFTIYNDFLYLPVFSESVDCQIFYNTDFSAMDEDGIEKKYLENESDISLIPEAFQEAILVYGACMRLKSNPDHNKFKYWYSMYNDALSTMRSKTSPTTHLGSQIKLQRG